MAKKLGATVIGHATGEKLKHLESLGAARAIDYASEEFDDPNLGGGGLSDVDIVIDLSGESSLSAQLH